MNETIKGYNWDISFDSDLGLDVILVDRGDTVMYLTMDDLASMQVELSGYEYE